MSQYVVIEMKKPSKKRESLYLKKTLEGRNVPHGMNIQNKLGDTLTRQAAETAEGSCWEAGPTQFG